MSPFTTIGVIRHGELGIILTYIILNLFFKKNNI